MKKLLLLSALLIFACSSDDSNNNYNNNNQDNVLTINNQEYPLAKGVLQFYGPDPDGIYEYYLVFGESTLPDNIFSGGDSGYNYQGYYIDIGYVSNTSDGTGVFTDVWGDYDLSFDSANQEEETFTIIGDNVSSALSVTNSENIYTVELNTYDENGNSVEVYYNGNISIYNGN